MSISILKESMPLLNNTSKQFVLIKIRDNIMNYYRYLLKIDIDVYEKSKNEEGLIDVMAIRLDCIKKILAAFFYDRARFEAVEPQLENIIDK